MKDVIVFAGTTVGSVLSLLEKIRTKYRINTYVLTINTDYDKIFRSSSFVDFSYNINFIDKSLFLDEFKAWFKRQKFKSKPIIYFTTDTSCYLVSLHRAWFEEHFELCLPSNEIVKIYTEKGLAEFDAQRNGLFIPRTTNVEREIDISSVLSEFKFPVILKPKSTYQAKKSPFKVMILGKNEFKNYVTTYLREGYGFVCQEYIPGEDTESFFYLFYRSKSGMINDVVGRKVLQNPPRAGIMAKGIIERHESLMNDCRCFLEKINYVGIGGIEFKKYNNKFYFIEMSTRLEGFFKISNFSSYSIALNSYEDLNNISFENGEITNKFGAVYYDVLSTVMSRIKNKDYMSIFGDFWDIFFGKNRVLNTYDNKDKKPFFLVIRKLMKH